MSESNNSTPKVVNESNVETQENNDSTPSAPVAPSSHAAPAAPVAAKKNVSFMLDVESKAIIETLVDTLEGFSVENLMALVPRLIMHVENYKNLSGPQKKGLVIKMLHHIVDITDCPGDDEVLDPIVKRLIPPMIDTLIDVNKGKLKLKKKPSIMKLIMSCLKPQK